MSTWRSIVQLLTGRVGDLDGTTKSYPDVQLSSVQLSMHLSHSHVARPSIVVHMEVSLKDLLQVMMMVNRCLQSLDDC